MTKGFDSHNFVIGMASHMRNLLVCKDPNTVKLLEVSDSVQQKYIDQAIKVSAPFALRSLGVLSKTDVDFKSSKNTRLLVELALMQLCSITAELEKKNP